ncbi:VC0807 family protein [Nocardia wallacei]|uniref:VC0807 family protein n=1 Tax=Nocardia wallacei TaxID=480035 RepID=UPI0024558D4C|nr:VC0807 family protein [Nocardia wallacei]
MTETAVLPSPSSSRPRSSRAGNLLFTAAAIGLSPAVFYGLLALGYTEFRALLWSTIAAGLWLLAVAGFQRRIDGLAAFAFCLTALGLGLALLGGDDRMMLIKDPATSAAVSILLAASCVLGRPALFGMAQRLHAPGRDQEQLWNTLWHSDSEIRRAFRRSTAVWAAGLAVDAIVRLLLILTLPVSAAVGLMNPVQWAVIALLVLYTVRGRRRIDIKSRLARLTEPAA